MSEYILDPLRIKYYGQHLIFKHPKPKFLPQCEQLHFTRIKKTGKIIVLHILVFKFLGSKLKVKRFCTE